MRFLKSPQPKYHRSSHADVTVDLFEVGPKERSHIFLLFINRNILFRGWAFQFCDWDQEHVKLGWQWGLPLKMWVLFLPLANICVLSFQSSSVNRSTFMTVTTCFCLSHFYVSFERFFFPILKTSRQILPSHNEDGKRWNFFTDLVRGLNGRDGGLQL